jgi:hypothetical protein
VEERRRHLRQRVDWPIRLWVNDTCFLAGKAADAGVEGAFVCMAWLPSGILRIGHTYRVDFFPGTPEQVRCAAVVRHVTWRGVGLEIIENLAADRDAEAAAAAAE